MKKILTLLTLLLFLTVSVSAQTPIPEGKQRVYCELYVIHGSYGSRNQCYLNYQGIQRDVLMGDNYGFETMTMMNAMNYLGKYGWMLSQIFNADDGRLHWLLYKDINPGEDPMQGIKTGKALDKKLGKKVE